MKRTTRKQKKNKEYELLKESNIQKKHIEDVQNEDNRHALEDNSMQVEENFEGNNRQKEDNLHALEDNETQCEQSLEAMMENDESIQDVDANLPGKRKPRGPTKIKRLPSNFANRIEVEFNVEGTPIGEGSIRLSSYLGPLVREHVPVTLDNWKHLDDDLKAVLWESIQARFKLDEQWQKVTIFKQMGCIFRCSKSRLVKQILKAKSKEERLQMKPDNIRSTKEWNDFITLKTSSKFKVQSQTFKVIRRKQMPHTCGRKGMARLAADMRKESPDPSSVSRVHVWVKSHTRKNGEPVNMAVGETIEKIKEMENESQSSSTTNVREDALSVVLGQDKPGRLRGMGRDMTLTKYILSQANQKHTAQLQNRVVELERTVHMLLSQNQRKGNCTDDNASQTNKYDKIHDKCNLLDWTGMDEIVAEGRVLSTDPKELIHNIPLGPNAMKILIDSPKKSDAFLWRSTPRMITHIGEAKDEIVAWPADRVVLHTTKEYEKEDNMSKTSSTNIKCKLFDWIGGKELVAEGRLYSSDPKQLVNNIPLGPSAVLILIDETKIPNAFLWRPPAGMTCVGDAIGSKVAWPEANVVVENIDVTTSSRTVNAVLPSTSTNMKSNTKCKLIGLDGVKEVIAEGRVSSVDPKVLVHFVPLGENAVKVWVDTVKIPNARLWRPTSDFEMIEDAIGSTIAWPSANVIADSTSSNC